MNQISIWDIESGELWKKFDTDFKIVLGISPDMDYAVFRETKTFKCIQLRETRGKSSEHARNGTD